MSEMLYDVELLIVPKREKKNIDFKIKVKFKRTHGNSFDAVI